MLNNIKKLYGIMWKYARSIVFGNVILIALSSLFATLNVQYTQVLIDKMMNYATKESGVKPIMVSAMILGGIQIGSAVFVCIASLLEVKCEQALTNHYEPVLLHKFRKIHYQYFEEPEVKNLIKRVSEEPYQKVKNVYFKFVTIAQVVLSLLGLCTVYLKVSMWLVLLFVLLVVPVVLIHYKSSTYWWELYNSQTEDERELQYLDSLLTTKGPLAELKVFKATSYIEKLWESKTDVMLDNKYSMLNKVRNCLVGKGLLISAWYIIALVATISMLLSHRITLGLFVAVIESTVLAVEYATSIADSLGTILRDIRQIEYVNDFMELEETPELDQEMDFDSITIEFKNVSFHYPDSDKLILKNLNFTVNPHENIALVGANGAGKSTIIKLLCRFYQPTDGLILVNGVDLQTLSYGTIKRYMGVVFQDYFNYELSLRENIAMGNLDKLDEDDLLMDAMKKSECYSIYESSTHGLDSPLGKLESEGVDLSGGQWQKLALSRAYFMDTKLLVLDEPTAAMDPIAENNMYQSFRKIMGKKGTIMISHRLASSKIADRILVLNNGTIVEEGSHDALMAQKGLYYDMFRSQACWYVEE